ncbi:MAG: geranylgeranylglycerol-phosphate geranylgeranyltransferase [Candidatus Latescibacteria bacterium]|nr:geranylgeranylglycerol-phosphate geranylgeranyltransferase [Candidatus Latescibacterota bacterium]
MRSFSAYLQLTRPVNCAIAFASVLVGAFVAGAEVAGRLALIAGLSEFCLCAGANVINDCYDMARDRLNKPARPLVTGRATRQAAIVYAVLLSVMGVGLGVTLGLAPSGVALFTALAALAYSAVLKKMAFVGNVTVSAVSSLAFVYGGLTGPRPLLSIVPAGFAFLFHLGREVLKDIEDAAGDAASRVTTVPVRYGTTTAVGVITGVFAALILSTLLPVMAGWYGRTYLALVILVDLILLYVVRSMWRDAGPANAGRLSRILKANMVLGLIALCAGR